MVYVASSMRSAKLFWVSKPKKLNKINKKAALWGSFFCCWLVVQKFYRRCGRVVRILRKNTQLVVDWLLNSSQSISQAYANNKRIIASGRITFRGGRGTVKRASGVKDFCKALVSRH